MQLQQPSFVASSKPGFQRLHGLPKIGQQRAASRAANAIDWEQQIIHQSTHYDAVSGQPVPKQLDALRKKFDNCIIKQDHTRFTDCNSLRVWIDDTDNVPRVQRLNRDAVAASNKRRAIKRNKHGNRDTSQWTAELAADLLAVLTEAGMSKGATKAVLNAAQRGLVTSNPGILLCQVLRIQSSLECGLGQRLTQAVLKKQPTLINMSSDMLTWHLEELAGIFGQDVTASMVVKCPLLLCNCPFTIWSKLEALRSLLGTSMQRAQQCVCRQPRLLTTSIHAIHERWRDLQEVTGLDEPALQKAVISQPALLTYHPATLADNMEHMAQQLNVQLQQVVKLVCRMPSLVMLKHSSFAAKLEGLAQALDCDTQQASSMVLRQPALLCLSTIALTSKVGQLASVLEVEQGETIRMIKANPSLLTLSPGSLSRKLRILQATIANICAVVEDNDTMLQRQAEQGYTQHSNPSIGNQHGKQTTLEPLAFNHDRSRNVIAAHTVDASTPPAVVSGQFHVSDWGQQDLVLSTGDEAVVTTVQPINGSIPAAQLPEVQEHRQVASQLAQAWARQYHSASPSIRAAFGCFSEKRYSRLKLIADSLHSTSRSSADVQRLAQRCSLSAMLRWSDRKFADMLATTK